MTDLAPATGTQSEVPANGGARTSRVPASATCSGTTRAGKPCRSKAVRTDGRCFFHSIPPEQQVELARAGARRSAEVRREQAKSSRDLLREQVERHFERIWGAFEAGLDSDDERVRIGAAVAVLAEAYGRPAQAIVGDPDKPVSFVLDSLLARARDEQ